MRDDTERSRQQDLLQQVEQPRPAADREAAQRQVERIQTLQAAESSRRSGEQALPFKSQQAMQTFRDNAPSVQERFGVELVGIDTFA
jgi:hypothetical protein